MRFVFVFFSSLLLLSCGSAPKDPNAAKFELLTMAKGQSATIEAQIDSAAGQCWIEKGYIPEGYLYQGMQPGRIGNSEFSVYTWASQTDSFEMRLLKNKSFNFVQLEKRLQTTQIWEVLKADFKSFNENGQFCL